MATIETKRIRNVALLGHSGCGKTSLAEAMLFISGGTDRLGKIADGNTVCDYDSEEIARKSTAIINACQYSFIFPLSPNDMDDLCTLYDKAGRINTVEQEQIVNNERGNAFIITGPTSRTNIEIVASPKLRAIFHE